MGRPRRDSNKNDSGSTAGNVYNASLAAAQKGSEAVGNTNVAGKDSSSSSSTSAPQTDTIPLAMSPEIEKSNSPVSIANIISPVSVAPVAPVVTIAPAISNNSTPSSSANIHRRSLSIAELVSLVSSSRNHPTQAGTGNTTPSTHHSSSSFAFQALNALNLPDALRSTLEKADSPILNALLPLIRQKLAAKTASTRRNSAVDPSSEGLDSTTSLDSQSSRRSSTSNRSEDHRLSHKLAERKRRKEMKDVFDNLRDVLPPGAPKSSKWEILNEASVTIDDLLEQEQNLLNQRNQLLKKINETNKN